MGLTCKRYSNNLFVISERKYTIPFGILSFQIKSQFCMHLIRIEKERGIYGSILWRF